MTRIPSAQAALDYPWLDDDLYVIWSSNDIAWPDGRRELHYLSTQKTHKLKGFALFTIWWNEAKTFETEAEAKRWLTDNEALRPHPYSVKITTVAELKVQCGFATGE